jgi:menaquinone-dependent protoporphyrinogen oxidase
MSGHVLVAYESKNGSTADVAHAIATRLGELGAQVQVARARDVRDLSGLDVLVVGAPIYSGRWLAGAHRVLRRAANIAPDSGLQFAIFALGPRVDEGPENWVRPREQFERALAKHASISPASTALFGGADPPRKSPRRDVRDWDAICSWAGEVAGLLGGPPGS